MKYKTPIVFEEMRPLILPFAIIFAVFPFSVWYQRAPHIQEGGFWHRLIEFFNIRAFDFTSPSHVDISLDSCDTEHLFEKIKANINEYEEPIASALFPELTDATHFLRCARYKRANQSYNSVIKLLVWQRAVFPQANTLIVFFYRNKYTNAFFRVLDLRIINIGFPYWVIQLWDMRTLLLNGLKSRLTSKKNVQRTLTPYQSASEVLYFPHMGISYGKLFEKNYFYDKDPLSPFASQNITHIEYGMDFSTTEGSYYLGFFNRRTARDIIEFFKKTFSLRSILGYSNILKGMEVIELFLRFAHYKRALKTFSNARLAIIGYDMLFPPSISMVLALYKIPTVAVQERFYPPFQGTFCGFALHTYLTMAPISCQLVSTSPNSYIHNCVAVGPVRSDWITTENEDKNLVAVFDYHSVLSKTEGFAQTAINWKANKSFYLDIIKLAICFTNITFVLRGKNANWMRIEYFDDIKEIISILPNIHVNSNYSTFKESYKLCSQAGLIIAKPTSLADESIAVGKNVIIHDYSHNSPTALSSAFNYFDAPFFCTKFEQVHSMVEKYVKDGQLMDDESYSTLRNKIFLNLADGNVHRHVKEYTRRMLMDAKNGVPYAEIGRHNKPD
jgi:hypothetical protein